MALTRAARASSAPGTGTGVYKPARAGITRSGFLGDRLLLKVATTFRSFNFDRTNWEITEDRGRGKRLSIEVFGFTPAAGEEIVLGACTIGNRLFRGKITRVRKVHHKL